MLTGEILKLKSYLNIQLQRALKHKQRRHQARVGNTFQHKFCSLSKGPVSQTISLDLVDILHSNYIFDILIMFKIKSKLSLFIAVILSFFFPL